MAYFSRQKMSLLDKRLIGVVSLTCQGRFLFGNDREDSICRRAFSRGDLLRFCFIVPRQLGTMRASVAIRSDADASILEIPLAWSSLSGADDVWSAELPPSRLTSGLYFIQPRLVGATGKIVGIRTDGVACSFSTTSDEYTYQLTLSEFRYPEPDWMEGGILYQVFVDRFCRGADTPVRDDAVFLSDWESGVPEYPAYPGAPLKNNTFFGGNLQGITKQLDYFVSLGVTCLYLSPIFEAYSNHKYDTGDYCKVDEMFGGESALRELIEAAKQRGIHIVLDGVFNHTGDDSVYFNRQGRYSSIGAYQSKESPYYDWYEFQNYPDQYTCWWNIPILPRIHTEVPSCRNFFLGDGGVIDRYASMGISGFRLDVVDELPDTFVSGLKERLSRSNPENILWGEVWEDASNKIAYGKRRKYYLGEQLDGVMNYELRRGILAFLRDHDPSPLYYALTEVMPNAPKRVQDCQMNLIGTHDTVRAMTALAGQLPEGHTNDELATMRLTPEERRIGSRRLCLAYLILATLPGIPTIYYGDEVGMEGYSDPFNRRPFPWKHPDEGILAFYRRVGALRRTRKEYRRGAFRLLRLDENVLAFSREEDGRRALTLINASDAPVTFLLTDTWNDSFLNSGKAVHGAYVLPPLEGTVLTQ